MADEKIIRKFSAETKALADTRSLIVTISTDSPDRDGDVVPKRRHANQFSLEHGCVQMHNPGRAH